jgi:ATP-dependent DNA ligase
VVRLAYAKGERSLARIGPRVGIPVRPALAQRLPWAEAIVKRLGTVHAEPKYDGFRLQLHRDGDRVWAFSRRLENVSTMFPELTAGVRRQLRARRAIIEGEAVVHDARTGRFLPFQVTMTRKRKHRIAEAAARHPLRLFAFDLLYADGRDYLPRPQAERHARLAALLRSVPDAPVAVTEVMVTDPEGDRFRTVAKIGSGPSEELWKALRTTLDRQATRSRPRQVDSLITPDVWVEPRFVVEVLADEITRSPRHTCGKTGDRPGYALRFPRLLDGVRRDKAPEDATTEREILELYRSQR